MSQRHLGSVVFLLVGASLLCAQAQAQQPQQQPQQQYTGGTPPEFTVDESQTVEPVNANDILEKFMDDKSSTHGWDWGEFTTSKGSIAFAAKGIATISVDRSKPGFVLSREIAFQKALLEAKKELLTYLETTISADLEKEFSEPSTKRQEIAFEDAKIQGIELQTADVTEKTFGSDLANYANSLTDGAFDKSVAAFADAGDKLLKVEVSKKLIDKGLDPSQPIDKQVLKEIMGAESFKRSIRAVSKSRISGIQVYKTFEALPPGQDGEIAVVIIQSKRTQQLAASIFSGNSKLAPGAVMGKPLRQQIPRDKKVLVGTFGAKFVKDDKNQWCLLSYGQAQPRSKKQRYVNSAMKKAKLNAMAMIRQFAGEMAQSEETKEDSENMTDFVGGTQEIELNEDYVEKIKTSAAAKNISGMRTVKSWNVKHPLTGQMIAGNVVSWCPSSSDSAKKLKRSMQAPPAHVTPSGGQAQQQIPPAQRNKGQYYGSGAEADDDF
jgi:hypothetical protein